MLNGGAAPCPVGCSVITHKFRSTFFLAAVEESLDFLSKRHRLSHRRSTEPTVLRHCGGVGSSKVGSAECRAEYSDAYATTEGVFNHVSLKTDYKYSC